jgi:ribosome biogenesis GTPase
VYLNAESDLCGNLPQTVVQAGKISYFSDIILSMFDTDICDMFLPYFQTNQACAFIDPFGVGKSKRINKRLGKLSQVGA